MMSNLILLTLCSFVQSFCTVTCLWPLPNICLSISQAELSLGTNLAARSHYTSKTSYSLNPPQPTRHILYSTVLKLCKKIIPVILNVDSPSQLTVLVLEVCLNNYYDVALLVTVTCHKVCLTDDSKTIKYFSFFTLLLFFFKSTLTFTKSVSVTRNC